ncbi:selenoprotein, putative [Plasmodium vivax]|nr:selenoprotein, putative [Plasmodium vivax]
MYYLKLFLKVLLLLFLSYDFIILKSGTSKALHGGGNFLKEKDSYQAGNSSTGDEKYVIFLRNIKAALIYRLICRFILFIYILISATLIFPHYLKAYIPSILLNSRRFNEMFENMQQKKLMVLGMMFFSYNIIYGMLCNTSVIHVYQNRNLIYDDYYADHLFVQRLRENMTHVPG